MYTLTLSDGTMAYSAANTTRIYTSVLSLLVAVGRPLKFHTTRI